MAGCNNCEKLVRTKLSDPGATQPSGANPGPIADLDYDRAIFHSKMASDQIKWITYFNIKPCECEKDKELKQILEETRKIIDFVLEKL